MKTKNMIKKIAQIAAITLFCANVAFARAAAEPKINITYMPPIGQQGYAEGNIAWDGLTSENTGQYAVIAMLHAVWDGGGGYYVKPYDNNYLNPLDAGGHFSILLTTGGIDADVDEVIFFFVERQKITDQMVANPTAMAGNYLATTTVYRSTWVNPPQSPTSSVRPGFVPASTQITLSSQAGSAIRFTVDGSNPITSSTAQTYSNTVFRVPESGALLVKAAAKVSDTYSSVASFVWFPEEPLSTPFWGLDVSLALNGEPFGYSLSEAATRERMAPVAQLAQWVRTFGTIHNGNEYINKIAKASGLHTLIGLYISSDTSSNNAQIEGLRQILQTGPAPDAIVVGNETNLSGTDPAVLSACLDAVREMLLKQGLTLPVGTADIAGYMQSQSILEKLDFIGVNIYSGTWDNVPENQMLDALKLTYAGIIAQYPSKLILLTEAGTPYDGGSYSVPDGTQTASQEKAANYLCGFLDWIQQNAIPAFYFEAYDEPAKSMNGGHPIEQYFGIMDGNLQIHPFYCECIPLCGTNGLLPVSSGNTIKIHPNPTTGKVFWETDANIKLYNTQGIVLQKLFGRQVDLSDYPQGIYLLQINDTWIKVRKK